MIADIVYYGFGVVFALTSWYTAYLYGRYRGWQESEDENARVARVQNAVRAQPKRRVPDQL